MHTRKAVILARGLGTRMQKDDGSAPLDDRTADLASRGLKGLIPIHGRPFLDYVIAELLEAGLNEITLVVGPESDELRVRDGRRALERDAGEIDLGSWLAHRASEVDVLTDEIDRSSISQQEERATFALAAQIAAYGAPAILIQLSQCPARRPSPGRH